MFLHGYGAGERHSRAQGRLTAGVTIAARREKRGRYQDRKSRLRTENDLMFL